jgi:methylenetetrahydrofolate--tRNA-(uracil-5-)-methyltransferase
MRTPHDTGPDRATDRSASPTVRAGTPRVRVIGGGMGGCEAAWQLARRGIPVALEEMRPVVPTPAHRTDRLAEIVCSNSFKSDSPDSAAGLLKAELRALGSLLIAVADGCRVPAGHALAIEAEPLIEVARREATSLDDDVPTIVATGPLTSGPLAEAIAALAGRGNLYFFDAIAPVVHADSIDRSVAWLQSRHDKGDGAYLNCPLDAEQYRAFVAAVTAASRVELKEFEKGVFFEGCLPIEELARRGEDTLRYGPMKPIGLVDPRTGRRPHAAVQLRQDDAAAELYGLVGFQTNLRFPDQERILRSIPGLQEARFARLGQMHRNAYVDPPAVLHANLRSRARRNVFLAGQLCGVEGYVESMAAGLVAALNVAADLGVVTPPPDEPAPDAPDTSRGDGAFVVPPGVTMIGALLRYVTDPRRHDRQPMNAAFGLVPPLQGRRLSRRDRYAAYARRGLEAMERWAEAVSVSPAGARAAGA